MRYAKKFILFLMIFVFTSTVFISANAASESTMNKYNVVLVTDTSGSMANTDPLQYRFEAIDLFVGLISNGGNKVGSVVFSNGVISQQKIREIEDKNDKLAITNDIKNQPARGWTDTGGALMAAVNMLKSDGDKSLPSIIILLADGNTEMGTAEQTQTSINNKETAMEIAREEGYNIYTICLNSNNGANPTEMRQIAAATGGQFQEVTDAADLQSVFDLYYRIIYSTSSEKLVDEKISSNGILSREFKVADVGVEEVNIAVFGDVSKCSLTTPTGNNYTDSQIDDISYVAKTFRILKVVDPAPGTWKLDVYGTAGTTIKVFKIYNPNLNVNVSLKNESDSYIIGQPVDFVAEIFEGKQPLNNVARYAGCEAVLYIKDYNNQIVEEIKAEGATNEGFALQYVPKDYGTYYATVTVSSDEIHSESETFILNVGNLPPVAKSDVIKKHINIWPFLIKTDSSIDLSEMATDNEDSELGYKINSSTWLEEDYTLDGSTITINNFSVSKGSFEVQAYDSQGAYCTFNVKVTSTNIGVVAMILLGIGALAALIAIITVIRILAGKAFMGTVTVENLETGDTGTFEKSRGQMRLAMFSVGDLGFDPRKCHFQATGKNYIYFVSNKPFTSDFSFSKTKKLKIDSSIDIRIYADDSQTKGFIVRFESILNNSF